MKYTVCEVWSDSGCDDLELHIFKDRATFMAWLDKNYPGHTTDEDHWYVQDTGEFSWNIRVQDNVEVK